MTPLPAAARTPGASDSLAAPPAPEFAQNPASSGPATEHTLRIAGMSCAACVHHVQRALEAVPGVGETTVDLLTRTARLHTAPDLDGQLLVTAVRRAGYDVLAGEPEPNSSLQNGSTRVTTQIADEPGQATLGLRAVFALGAGALAMVLSMPLMPHSAAGSSPDRLNDLMMRLTMPLLPAWLLAAPAGLLRWTLLLLALATMLFAAPEIYRAAWRATRHRTTNMNTMVALGTLVAFLASAYTTLSFSVGHPSRNFTDVYFEAVVFILAFLLAGRYLEAGARHRANTSLRSLAQAESSPVRWIAESNPASVAQDASSLLNSAETLLPLDAVAVGDLVRVLPGDRIPLDGIVLAGRSSVDESTLTGEPLPVTRGAGDKLSSGTLNLDGPLLVRVTALGSDSMQAQVTRLLERARATRAPMQRLADRASAVFVPAVLALAAITFLTWAVLDNTGSHALGYGRALSLAIAVLVVACPCAMGLAVPAAVAVSLGTAARAGVLIKGGEPLERLALLDTLAFDKTGTLTEGRPGIVAFPIQPGLAYPEMDLLRWADALEQLSTHPLAQAVRSFAALHGSFPTANVTDAQVLPGLGIRGSIEGHSLAIGSSDLLQQVCPSACFVPPAGLEHATPLHLLIDAQHAATFFATDTARPSASAAVRQVHALGVRSVLLTGDTLPSASALAKEVGLDRIYAGLLPAGKLTAIASLQQTGDRVGMAGDGLNDAAALAQADVGIAMAAGTDLAREAGHVLLLHNDLRLIPLAIRLARRTRRLMRENLAWAVLYNVLGIPIAAGVLLPHFGLRLSPALASAAMALSSVSVLLNSLRLARPLR